MSEALDPSDSVDEGAADPEAGGADQVSQNGKPDQVQALLRKLKKTEKLLADRMAADEESAKAKLSEADQLKANLQKLESERNGLAEKLKLQAIEHRFEQAALKAGVIDADAARRLADFSEVEIDDNGAVSGIDAVIADLKKSRKYLFGSLSTPVGNAGGNPPAGPPSTKPTEKQIQSMNSEEFQVWMRTQQSR